MNNCTCKQASKQARNKRRRQNRKAKQAEKYYQDAERRRIQNQTEYYLELWVQYTGLKYETIKDLMGLEFH